uniref:Uncharacterized protein n=1 Tax=Calidris pygmaea TaxID=425635 RepID=A0A8C3JBT8_9CHAR
CVSRTRLKLLPSPPRKGKRGWTEGQVMSLPYFPLGWCKMDIFALAETFTHKIPHSPDHPLGGRSLVPLSAAFSQLLALGLAGRRQANTQRKRPHVPHGHAPSLGDGPAAGPGPRSP